MTLDVDKCQKMSTVTNLLCAHDDNSSLSDVKLDLDIVFLYLAQAFDMANHIVRRAKPEAFAISPQFADG